MSAPLSFHPLADLFPLIEGDEFEKLVASVKANGQREAIILLNGEILDGRNRYRACLAAGIEPRVEKFTGGDPVSYVTDINCRRRHLSEAQRALIAAKLTTLSVGRPPSANEIAGIPAISQAQAASMLNVSRDSVMQAKAVLNHGTAEEVRSVERGEAGVRPLADAIRERTPKDQRAQARAGLSATGKNPERIERQRLNAQMWGQFRDALINLTSLPLPADVVAVARTHDKIGLIDTRLLQALEWLEGFSDAWTSGSDSAQAKTTNGKDHAHPGAGGPTPRA